MTRNQILLILVAVLVGTGTVTWGQAPTSTDWVLRETFDDNRLSKLWKAYQADPNAQITETNKRLEFTAVRNATETYAGIVGSDWYMDPNHNFTMKADFHHDLLTFEGAWISFGLTPDRDKPRNRYLSIGIGCTSGFNNYWNEWKDGFEISTDFTSRPKDKVTLYISYVADEGTVYVSDTGYSRDDAWVSFDDIVDDRWDRPPLYVFLGGNAEGAGINPGRLYMDEFVVESGVIVKEGQTTPQPPDPNDPTKPPTGGDLIVPAMIAPSVMRRASGIQEFSAMVALPMGIDPGDVNLWDSLFIVPGNLAALRQGAFESLTGRTIVVGVFSADELLAVTPDGPIELQLVGTLNDGRAFTGSEIIAIR